MLNCGDLHKGFARVYCDQCGHNYLLAYSFKTRYFRPSCHQKRILKLLSVWDLQAETRSPAGPDPPWPNGETIPLTYHSRPDIA